MIVDTSALVAMLKKEPEAEAFLAAIGEADNVRMSVVSLFEATTVIDGVGDPILSRQLDNLVQELAFDFEPVTLDQAGIARQAYRDFGRRSLNPAQLNFGDCFAYALATAMREPLLFKGNDFIHTDVTPAILPG